MQPPTLATECEPRVPRSPDQRQLCFLLIFKFNYVYLSFIGAYVCALACTCLLAYVRVHMSAEVREQLVGAGSLLPAHPGY